MEIVVIAVFAVVIAAVLLYEFYRYGFFSSYVPVLFVLTGMFAIFIMAASYVK